MPPTTKKIPGPGTEMDGKAMRWLESQGLTARIPTVHSSDFNIAADSPFSYYLERRLGLTPALTISDAISHGSWFHAALEVHDRTLPEIVRHVETRLRQREKEIREAGAVLNLSRDTLDQEVARVREDAHNATAWLVAAARFKLPNNPMLAGGFLEYLSASHLTHLGNEVRLRHRHPNHPASPLVVVLDKLYYSPKTNRLWPLDAKTCADAKERASVIRVEPQPMLQIFVVQALLDSGILQKHFGLPANVELGGILHLLVEKPSIRMCAKDCDYSLTNSSKRSNRIGIAARPEGSTSWRCIIKALDPTTEPDFKPPQPYLCKEQIDAEKYLSQQVGTQIHREPQGEPRLSRYAQRCQEWYDGTGEYASERDSRLSSPPVLISTTSIAHFDDTRAQRRFKVQLANLMDLATRPAHPCNFPETARGMERWSGLYAPFFTSPVAAWPELTRSCRLIPQFRDDDLYDQGGVLDTSAAIG